MSPTIGVRLVIIHFGLRFPIINQPAIGVPARNLSHTRLFNLVMSGEAAKSVEDDEPIVTVFHTGLLSRDQDVDAFQRCEQKWLDDGGKGFGLVVTRNPTTTDSPLLADDFRSL